MESPPITAIAQRAAAAALLPSTRPAALPRQVAAPAAPEPPADEATSAARVAAQLLLGSVPKGADTGQGVAVTAPAGPLEETTVEAAAEGATSAPSAQLTFKPTMRTAADAEGVASDIRQATETAAPGENHWHS